MTSRAITLPVRARGIDVTAGAKRHAATRGGNMKTPWLTIVGLVLCAALALSHELFGWPF